MPIRKTVRIYDLARELKQDTKRVMEDLRRAGADVSVASNSVSAEFAEKVRSKYFPKTETAPKRTIKVIKASKKEEVPEVEELAEVAEAIPETVEPEPAVEVLPPEIEIPVETKPVREKRVSAQKPEPVAEPEKRRVRTLRPKEIPAAEPEPEQVSLPTVEIPEPEPQPAVVGPTGTTVKTLKLTSEAVRQGIKPGDRFVTEARTQSGRLETTRPADARGRGPEFRGTPGETAAPQMTYTPPADNRRRPGRSGGRKSRDDRAGKFAEREIDIPRQTTIEERVLHQVGAVDLEHLKSVRLTEGATIREFAAALGITPRDIVQLLIKRGIFATLNQPIGEKMAAKWVSILVTMSALFRLRKW